ncbi:hypothetical protein [Skermania piniformis]|uniref:DUF3828 domain-containing protein n=1 Tax=Skermania pinensis TaxID=39122 RepID=A0ABX8SAP8_9ACTN|nr:hypothetical protein [Skermania piniformis]QXQ13545.1 hypothetical protein KV203_17260 [Skermania piniformis]
MGGWLAHLTPTVSIFANLAADALREPPGSVSPVPAMVRSDEEAAARAMGEPGDLTNPAQVAVLWYSGLLGDLAAARALTYAPAAWGDYRWAIDHVERRSLASKVIPAVDAPDRIAFMRFVPQVAQSSRVFQAFVTAATFITLLRLDDGSWRVWGLGPRMPPALEIIGERPVG